MKKIINIFKKLFKMATKQELEQQLAEAISVAQRLGTENKKLIEENKSLAENNTKLLGEFNAAVERVRYLDNQLRMKDAQKQAFEKYNDNNRNY